MERATILIQDKHIITKLGKVKLLNSLILYLPGFISDFSVQCQVADLPQ